MDLSVHAKEDEQVRTIFEDAEYFSKGYSYKLMPITFEPVNETIIHIEHNYCHCVPSEVPESKESHNNTTHEGIEEKIYNKRKIKSLTMDNNSTSKDREMEDGESMENLSPGSKSGEFSSNSKMDDNSGNTVRPLDLSLPLPPEQKTDKMSTENESNVPKVKPDAKNSSDVKQLNVSGSNKENVTAPATKIEVTISRPEEKGYYRPCEVFLNDLAGISPDLIRNDCHEIEVIDRTRNQEFHEESKRTYYIVLESTWRMFEDSTERIILTNDSNIGQPVQNNEKNEKLRYLIFDQYSLTESLTKLCESKGGNFEYTFLEEPRLLGHGMQESVNSSDHGSDPSKSGVNSQPGSDRDNNTERVPENRLRSLVSAYYIHTALLENSNKMRRRAEPQTEQLHQSNVNPDNPSNDEELSKISEPRSVSEDKGSTQLKDESQISNCNSSSEPVKSAEQNLSLNEPINMPIESKEIDNKSCDLGGSPIERAAELVNEEKCAINTGSGKTSSISQPEVKGTKRVRLNEENGCTVPEKIRKLNAPAEAQNITENEKVQKNLENVNEEEKTEQDPNSSFHLTKSKDAQPLGKETAKVGMEIAKCLPKNRIDKDEPAKVANIKEMKGKSRRIKKKITCTDIKTRSSKQVSVLRNGKQRFLPSTQATTAKQERDKIDSVKILKPKLERTEGILKTRGRTRKSKAEESKKICLRKKN